MSTRTVIYDPADLVVTINGERYTGFTQISFDSGVANNYAPLTDSNFVYEAEFKLDADASRELRVAIEKLRKAQRLEKIRWDIFRAFKRMVGHLLECPLPNPELRWERERERLRSIRQPGLANRFPRIHASAPRQAVPSRSRRRTRTWER